MLIRLSGEQIAHNWKGWIRKGISRSLPIKAADLDDAMNNILNQLMLDKIQAWVVCTEEEQKPLGICTTQIVEDSFTGEKQLLILTNYSFDSYPEFLWAENYLQLTKYAKKEQCTRIYCYSNNERVIEMAEQSGADSSQVLLTFPLL